MLSARVISRGALYLKIKVSVGQRKVLEDQGHDGWVLVRLLAPAQAADARRPPLAVMHALTRLIDHLVPSDFVGLVSFGDVANVVLPVTEVSQESRARLQDAIK